MRYEECSEKEAVLSVHDVVKRYGSGTEALRGVSFRLQKGETVGIIGRNGAGKTTLLKIVAGVTRPENGKIRMKGRCGGILELGAAFYPSYTGRENIRFTASMMGLSRKEIRKIIPSVIRFSGLGNRIDAPVKTYSTGMFVRLAFSIAVCSTPDILLIDEALSVGDAEFQKKCYERIREMTEHSTVLMVSHDLYAIARFCTRIMVMEEGKVVFDGEPRKAMEVYNQLLQCRTDPEEARVLGLDTTIKNSFLYKDSLSVPFELTAPPNDCISGEGKIRITACCLLVDGQQGIPCCREGQRIRILMQVDAQFSTDELIVGYQVRDRCGTEIFGETQLDWEKRTGKKARSLQAGRSFLSFSFVWPRVREGTYFITPGIGTGQEVLIQREQCWLNDVFSLTAIVEKGIVYGMFNVPMEEFSEMKEEHELHNE